MDMNAAKRALANLIHDGRYDDVHTRLIPLFRDEVFDHRNGLTPDEACALSYERMRFLNTHAGPGRKLVADPHRLFAAQEWAALHDNTLLILMSIHYTVCVGSLLEFGAGRDDLEDWLAELDAMTSWGVFMVTEADTGSNAPELQTEAVYDYAAGEFVLHTPTPGAAKYMPNTGLPGVGKLGIVMARLKVGGADHGVFPFMVRLRTSDGPTEGVRIVPLPDKPAMALDNAITSFDRVRIPHHGLLSGPMGHLTRDGVFTSDTRSVRRRFMLSMRRVHAGRVGLTTAIVATTRAAVLVAVCFAQRRQTYAPDAPQVPLLDYRCHQRSLLGALATAYALSCLMNQVKNLYIDYACGGGDPASDRDTEATIAITKAFASASAGRVLQECRERCGAAGIFSENRVIDYQILNETIITAEGDNRVIALKAVRDLTATPPSAIIVGHGDQPERVHDLGDARSALNALELGEHALHRELATRGAGDTLAEWNTQQVTALEFADIHGARLALGALLRAADRLSDPDTHRTVTQLATVYGLEQTRRHATTLLASGVLHADQLRPLSATLDELCEQLTPHLSLLVDGFGIPPELLRSPLTNGPCGNQISGGQGPR